MGEGGEGVGGVEGGRGGGGGVVFLFLHDEVCQDAHTAQFVPGDSALHGSGGCVGMGTVEHLHTKLIQVIIKFVAIIFYYIILPYYLSQ